MGTPFSRPFLMLCGVLYLGFGLAVLLAPEPGASGGGLYPGLLRDIAGSHGGLNAAAGLFLVFAAFSGPWHRPGVLLVALMNSGYLAGRLIAVAEGAPTSTLAPAVMALESMLLAIALILACRVSKGSGPSRRPLETGRHSRPGPVV